jgi:lipopolysaccharide/colanic/teichoic acid biosynthesis glycosyltransferase
MSDPILALLGSTLFLPLLVVYLLVIVLLGLSLALWSFRRSGRGQALR